MSYFIEWLLELWVATWRADESLHGPSRRRWPWVVLALGIVVLVLVFALEERGVIRW